MSRLASIDFFRGITIIGMVFYTLLLRFSKELPYLLNHNIKNMFHPGDLILPMFLFASGMSLVFFVKKRKDKNKLQISKDVIKKIIKLLFVWLFISYFATLQFFAVDEIMLNIILFIPCIILVYFSDKVLIFVNLLVFSFHIYLHYSNGLVDISTSYLGGYQGAILWLPIMSSGVLIARNLENSKKIFVYFLALTFFSFFISPPFKMQLTPSFILLSITASILFYEVLKNQRSDLIEYLGRKPLRYWVLMFILIIIPLHLNALRIKKESVRYELDWEFALPLICICLVVMYLASKFMDLISNKLRSSN